MQTSSLVLLHNNACLHTAARTRALLKHFNWELFDHPPYSPDLTQSDYHLFIYLKDLFGAQRFVNNELSECVKMWLSSQVENFFDKGIQKLIPRYNASIPTVTALRSSLNMYVFLYNKLFFLVHRTMGYFLNSSSRRPQGPRATYHG
jgi:hypothetical protein